MNKVRLKVTNRIRHNIGPKDMMEETKKPKVTGHMLWSQVSEETERLHRLRRLHRKNAQGEPERFIPVAPDASVDTRLSFEHWAATSDDFRSEAETEHMTNRKRIERENRLLEKLLNEKTHKTDKTNKTIKTDRVRQTQQER